MSSIKKISVDGVVGHKDDVVVGRAKVCFNEFKGVWIKPGGGMIFTRKRAEQYCQQLNNLIGTAPINAVIVKRSKHHA